MMWGELFAGALNRQIGNPWTIHQERSNLLPGRQAVATGRNGQQRGAAPGRRRISAAVFWATYGQLGAFSLRSRCQLEAPDPSHPRQRLMMPTLAELAFAVVQELGPQQHATEELELIQRQLASEQGERKLLSDRVGAIRSRQRSVCPSAQRVGQFSHDRDGSSSSQRARIAGHWNCEPTGTNWRGQATDLTRRNDCRSACSRDPGSMKSIDPGLIRLERWHVAGHDAIVTRGADVNAGTDF